MFYNGNTTNTSAIVSYASEPKQVTEKCSILKITEKS